MSKPYLTASPEERLAFEVADLKANLAALESRIERPVTSGVGDVGARVYRSSSQSIADTVETTVLFNAQSYASSGVHSTSVNPGRLIAPSSGIYIIGYSILFTQIATSSRRRVLVRLNETDFIGYSDMFSGTSETIFDVLSATVEWSMTAGDFVDFRVYQDSGGSLDLYGADVSTTNAWIRRVA